MKCSQGLLAFTLFACVLSSWSNIGSISSQPLQGFCTQQVTINSTRLLLSFGGQNMNTLAFSNALIVTELSDQGIVTQTTFSNGPSGRMSQCCCSFANYFYVYGGTQSSGSRLNDLWQFDTVSTSWTKKTIYPNPASANLDFSRVACAMICQEDNLIVLGDSTSALSAQHFSINLSDFTISHFPLYQVIILQIINTLWDGQSETVSVNDMTLEGQMTQQQTIINLLNPLTMTLNQNKTIVSTAAANYVLNPQNGWMRVRQTTYNCSLIAMNHVVFKICNGSLSAAEIASTIEWFNAPSSTTSVQLASLTYKTALSSGGDLVIIGAPPNAFTYIYVLAQGVCSSNITVQQCWYGWPICLDGYSGQYCEQNLSIDGLILVDKFRFRTFAQECSDSGVSSNTQCICNSQFSGEDCSQYNKPECKGILILDYPLAICECTDQTIGGINCELQFCYNDCTNIGVCQTNAVCQCKGLYTGADCSILEILIDFSYTRHVCTTLILLLLINVY